MMPGWYKRGDGVVVSFVFCHFLCQISSSVRPLVENGTRRRRTRRRVEGNIFTTFPQTVLLNFAVSNLVVVAY